MRILAAIAVVALAACGGGSTGARTTGPVVNLTGSILGSGQPFGQGLYAYELPGLQPHELDLARDLSSGVGFGVDYLGAYWVDADHALTFTTDNEGRVSHLIEASSSGPPRRIGPPLEFVSSFDVRAGVVMATTCDGDSGRVRTLDLQHPSAWREIGRSCTAALSPDGDRVAFVRNRTEIWVRSLAKGTSSLRADVATVPAVRQVPVSRRAVITVAWGEGGLAAEVGSGSRFEVGDERDVIVAMTETGPPRAVPVPPQSMFVPAHPWQPKGGLLAFIAMPSSGGSVVRLFDPRTGKVWVVAADAQWFGNVVWSPDGRTLVGNTSTNAMLFVDTKGRWVSRIGTGGVGLLDWSP